MFIINKHNINLYNIYIFEYFPLSHANWDFSINKYIGGNDTSKVK